MFIVQFTYQVPLEEVDKYQQAHRQFLDYYYKQGLLLASGPMKPRTGCIILAMTQDREMLESVLQQDPYYMADVAQYTLIEFSPTSHHDAIKNLIRDTEGKLC